MQSNSYIFSIGFMLLVLLYLLVMVLMVTRLRRQKIYAKVFFGLILLYMLIRFGTLSVFMLVAMNVMSINDNSIVYNFAMNAIFICDCIFVIAFFALFRFYLSYKYYSHIPLFAASEKPFFENSRWFTFPLIIFLAIQIIVFILYNTPILGVRPLMINDCVQNLLLITFLIIFHFYLVFKFSGSPYKSNILKKNTRIITFLTFYFAFSRFLLVFVNIYLSEYETGVFDLIESPPDQLIWKQFILVASLIITEIIPFVAISSRSKLLQEKFQETLLNVEDEEVGFQNKSLQIERADTEDLNSTVEIEDLLKIKLSEDEKGSINPF